MVPTRSLSHKFQQATNLELEVRILGTKEESRVRHITLRLLLIQ